MIKLWFVPKRINQFRQTNIADNESLRAASVLDYGRYFRANGALIKFNQVFPIELLSQENAYNFRTVKSVTT